MRRLLALLSSAVLGAACGGGSGVGNNNNGGGECGNGVVEGGESCDGTDLGGEDCFGRGYLEGTLGCTATCTFDESGCSGVNPCGNGTREATEICDGADLGGATCEGLGFSGGTLLCTNRCELDTSGCEGVNPCGNGRLDANEACDGTRLGDATCESEGYAAGVLACTAGCALDTSGCVNAAGYVTINELALGNPDWIELYNPTAASVDLGGWEIRWWGLDGQGNPTDATLILPAYDLAAGEFVVLQDAFGQAQDPVVAGPGLIDLRNNISWDYGDPGALLLSDAGGAVDYLRWGDDTFDPGAASWADTPGFVPSDFPQGRTLGRRIDGVDTDTAGDWCVQETSDGTGNAGCLEPGVLPCELLITEIDVGVTNGTPRPDSVELQNIGSAPIELGGLVFAWWSSQGGNGGDVLPDYTLDPGARVVIVDDVQNWQQVSADPQNGLIHVHNISWSEQTEGACAIQDPALGTGIDFVRWGAQVNVEPSAPDTWDDSAARVPMITDPTSTSLGRPGLVDTNTSADWCLMPLSLGDANASCL